MFVRIVQKYGVYENYLHRFPDRPLLHDASLGYPEGEFEVVTFPSYASQVQCVASYGLDGFANLLQGKSTLDLHLKALAYSEKAAVPGYHNLFEVSGYLKPEEIIEYLGTLLPKAIASPLTWKLGGKVLISSYCADAHPPATWKKIIAAVEGQFPGQAMFLLDLQGDAYRLLREFAPAGALSNESRERLKEKFRAYLDVADGIHFAGYHAMDLPDGHFAEAYYREYTALCREVLSEARYRAKLLGLSAGVGYINPFSGSTTGEEGTRFLRTQMEIALAADPDLIILPEWNEANEQNPIQPTVAASFSAKRILRSYMQRIRKEPPTPLPGDDLSVPNLILSYRYELSAGELLELEVLHVPDGSAPKGLEISVSLSGLDGARSAESGWEALSTAGLDERRFRFASEAFSKTPILIPALSVRKPDGSVWRFSDGFQYIRILPNHGLLFKWAKQPLRDLLPANSLRASAALGAGGSLSLRGEWQGGEALASLELLEDNHEIAALDARGETRSARGKRWWVQGSYSRMSPNANVRIELTGRGVDFEFRPVQRADNNIPPGSFAKTEHGVALQTRAGGVLREFYLVFPDPVPEGASLEVKVDDRAVVWDLSELRTAGQSALALDRGFFLKLETFRGLPELPAPILRDAGLLRLELPEARPSAVYQFRAISKSGKCCRSRPLAPSFPASAAAPRVTLPVWSQYSRRFVQADFPASLVTRLEYRFDPRRGALLVDPGHPERSGELGGGASYGGPFFFPQKAFPADASASAPRWAVEEGRPCIEFDGRGTYVSLGKVLPIRSWALAFEIKTRSTKEQILLTHRNYYNPLMELFLRGGMLCLRTEDYFHRERVVESGLPVPPGKWCLVSVRYDGAEVRFQVDRGPEARFPAFEHPENLTTAFGNVVFGGYGKERGLYFEGLLRSLRIDHAPSLNL